MRVTIKTLLNLPSLSQAEVIAGAEGLDQVVDSISVLEYAEPTDLQEDFFNSNEFNGNEIAISGFIHIKDDVDAQLRTIKRLHMIGEVGLILYYVGIFVPRVDPSVIALADSLGFTLICMPKNCMTLKYSEVIYEVIEIIVKNKMQNPYFVSEMLERISKLPEHQRNLDAVLRFISDHTTCAYYLVDESFNCMNMALWPAVGTVTFEDIRTLYKNQIKLIPAQPSVISTEGNVSICYKPIESENASPLSLIIVKENGMISNDHSEQAAEVVQLFIHIWSKGHGKIGIDELVKAILNDEPMKMRRLAEILNIDIEAIHHLLILSPSYLVDDADKLKNIYEEWQFLVSEILEQYYDIYFSGTYNDTFVIFLGTSNVKQAREAITEIISNMLKEQSDTPCDLITSYGHANTTEVRKAFLLCTAYLQYAKCITPHKNVFSQSELTFAKQCHRIISSGEASISSALQILSPLLDQALSHDALYETLLTYLLDADGSVSKTADLMYIHKNTIKYRINRIQEILKMDIRKMPEHYMLYHAVSVKRLLETQEAYYKA